MHLTRPRDPDDDEPCRAAVLGSPIAHSLSPVLHTAAYDALGLARWSYTSADVDETELVEHVSGLDDSWRGLSLTQPLKEVAFELAASVSPTAAATGSINTLVRDGDQWHGYNTDVVGIARALREAGLESVSDAVVVGSGATARSTVAALEALGCRGVSLVVRGQARPATVAQARAAGMPVQVLPLGQWPDAVDVVVSTVPRAASDLLADGLPPGRALLDVVYAGGAGRLEAVARGLGYSVVPGTAMLLHQAVEQVRLMTGLEPPVAAMRAALDRALAARSSETGDPSPAPPSVHTGR